MSRSSEMLADLSPENGLSAAELDAMAMAAFIGAFDDCVHEYTQKTDDGRRPDDVIMQNVIGIFDAASTYHQADSAQALYLMNTLAAHLEQAVCAHDHFSEALQQASDALHKSEETEHNHHHNDDDEDEDDPNHKGSKLARSFWRLWQAPKQSPKRLGRFALLFGRNR